MMGWAQEIPCRVKFRQETCFAERERVAAQTGWGGGVFGRNRCPRGF